MIGFLLRAKRLLILAAATALLPAVSAYATDNDIAPQTQEVFADGLVADNDLDNSRGAFSPIIFDPNSALTASSFGNAVIGGRTGNNVISSGSFNSTSGLVNVIQNSGNNVIIQSSTIVNLAFGK